MSIRKIRNKYEKIRNVVTESITWKSRLVKHIHLSSSKNGNGT